VSNILFQDYAGGIHSATFYLGAEKVELREDNIPSIGGSNEYNVRLNSEDIDGTIVRIGGRDNNVTFTLNSIDVYMTAKDDYYVEQLSTMSRTAQNAGEENPLFPWSWDIRFTRYDLATKTGVLDIGKFCSS